MKHIESYLGKKNLTPVVDKKNECIEIIHKITSILVSTKDISFSGKEVFIKTQPNNKIQILINKQKILEAFENSKILTFFTELQ
jgi:hypothetical protein